MGKVVTSIALSAVLVAGQARADGDARGRVATPAPVASGPATSGVASGDCARSLDALDARVGKSADPALRRDRGLCHEQLGHPYPAVDDYRAYLTARPDARDADDIRARLGRLELETGIVAPASAAPPRPAMGHARDGRSLEDIERDERIDAEADRSPLRRGKGFILGVGVGVRRYGSTSLGWSETVALDARYSLSRASTLLLELGFAHANATGTASSLGGAGLAVGYEARVALNPRVDDALLLGVDVGYQTFSQRSTGLVYLAVNPEARIGYRHVLGPALGLEALVDGGIALVHVSSAPVGTEASTLQGLVGVRFALVVGF